MRPARSPPQESDARARDTRSPIFAAIGSCGWTPQDRIRRCGHAGAHWTRCAECSIRRSLLGLFSFEGHYAIYPPGAGYRRHRDRFRDDDARVLSCVLYLNAGWSMQDGGALRMHFDGGQQGDVLPIGGTLVCFLSERFEHEVLPATRERLALTGWFRRRGIPI